MSNYINDMGLEDFFNTIVVHVKPLYEDSQIPTRGSEAAAGWDLYAYIPEGQISIFPGQTVKISTGLSMAIENNYFGMICARSGLATKKGLAPANKIGVIDSDYRGEIIVALHNHSNEMQKVEHGERIAQMIFQKFPSVVWDIVGELDETERGEGGFGSSGR